MLNLLLLQLTSGNGRASVCGSYNNNVFVRHPFSPKNGNIARLFVISRREKLSDLLSCWPYCVNTRPFQFCGNSINMFLNVNPFLAFGLIKGCRLYFHFFQQRPIIWRGIAYMLPLPVISVGHGTAVFEPIVPRAH